MLRRQVMPYKKKKHRDRVEPIVEAMAAADLQLDGDLNCALFTYAKRHVPLDYDHLPLFFKELDECVAELRRRFLVPFEIEAIKKHGDIE